MANEKEAVEVKQAIATVNETEAKVEKIKADRAAAEAKKDAEILAKHPKIGKGINFVRHNKWKIVAGAATGGASFAAGWFGHKIFGDKKAKTEPIAEETASNEVVETPFDA